jgi:Rrf2 family iron-sulfur cluster assembly transcriptional regulator
MFITRKIDYGFLALAHLARRYPGGYYTIRQISRSQRIPQKFLSVILKRLVNNHILVSRLGPAGGYALALPPKHITFKKVIEALEGPLYLNNCLAKPRRCARRSCKFSPIWGSVQRRFENILSSYSLADAGKACRAKRRKSR